MTYRNDWEKIVLAEIKPGLELNTSTWTKMAGDGYYISLSFYEIVDIKVNGISLTKTTTAALVDATAGTWWQDFWGKKIYVHCSDDSNPGAYTSGPVYTNSVVVFFWLGFANTQGEGANCIDFIPTDCVWPIFYEPWLNENSIESLSAVLADHFESAMEVQFGGLSFVNNGWWYSYRHTYLWNNKDVRIKVGEIGEAYANFETIFTGKCRRLKVSDTSASFELYDTRMGALYSLPTYRYAVADYPNLDPNAVDRPIPVLFGTKTNITPVCVNTSTHVYKITKTGFGGVTYAMNALDAVYKAGVLLTVTTDYTVSLSTGEFTLLVDPGNAPITCDAKGIKDGFNMATGLKDSTYSTNVADHLFFIFNVQNHIPVASLDLTSFAELKAARTQQVSLYLDTDTPTMEINRLFQRSCLYHFLPLLNGKFAVRYYHRVVPVGTLELREYDFDGFSVVDEPESVYHTIIVKYDKDPTTGNFKTVSVSTDLVDWHHSEKQTFEVETALYATAEAEAIRDFYSELLQAPSDKLDTSISLVGKNLLPSDKLIVSRAVETDLGTIQILADEIYTILETYKDLAGGKVGVVAQVDTQISIYTIHSDTPHVDSHGDHSDTVHGDGDYSDHTDDTHADVAHVDITHVDVHLDYSDVHHYDIYHANYAHQDVAHADTAAHTDIPGGYFPHVDIAHMDYTDPHGFYHDVPYQDIPHGDWPYTDIDHYDSPHVNIAHVDQTHGNVAHDDHAYIDTYSDEMHEDDIHGDHSDTLHTDWHNDVAHVDSEV